MMVWYALLTESNKENKANQWLARRNLPSYWAKYKSTVKINRHRRGFRWRAVIPGYLFLSDSRPSVVDWQVVLQAPGVRSVLKNGSIDYAVLTEAHIDAIRNIELALNSSELAATEGIPYKVGQRVRCSNDVLWQWEGPIVKIEHPRRLVVEVQLLGRATLVTVPADEVEPI